LYDEHCSLPLAHINAVQLQRFIHLLHRIVGQRAQRSSRHSVQNLANEVSKREALQKKKRIS